MKRTLSIIALAVLGVGAVLFVLVQENYEQNYPVYIATINDIPIPLDQYIIYLRTTVMELFEIGGEDIWHYTMTIEGMPTEEFAKHHALELIIYITLTNSQANLQLTEEQRDLAITQAQNIFDGFSDTEQERFDISVIENVRADILLHESTIQYLTQNYHPDERQAVWDVLYAQIRESAILIINTQTWDHLDISYVKATF